MNQKATIWVLSGVIVVLAIVLAVVLLNQDTETNPQTTAATQPTETETAENTEHKLRVDDVLQAFKDAGLEAENPREMTKDDYGLAPMKAQEAKRFFIPSLGEDAGGRVFSFNNVADLKQTKEYYDSLGKESAMFFHGRSKKETSWFRSTVICLKRSMKNTKKSWMSWQLTKTAP